MMPDDSWKGEHLIRCQTPLRKLDPELSQIRTSQRRGKSELDKKVVELFSRGMTAKEIGQVVSRSHSLICEILRNAGVRRNPHSRRPR